ncbi:MAG: NADH:ubiquinone reductase (Na(+)-transporting) subunit F, partial [Cyclobacteriaceae bacterium]|nr:NADH:ubiquinone reductase (Na(+)-transporting) subunit F [Cyclobacteriaceae bacterium]
TWLMLVYGTTQHAGLAENVLDHRLNCRTVMMNPINRWLYWNMNYHVEHHMFPLVPYYNLPKLHAIVKDDHPSPYPSIYAAFKEIIPAIVRQAKEPDYFVTRELPTPTTSETQHTLTFVGDEAKLQSNGFIEVCPADALQVSEVLRFDFDHSTYAIYHTEKKGEFYATDGICTHGSTHLAEGLVIGDQIECPKHNGRFDVTDGSTQRPPVCVSLLTYEVKIEDDKIWLNTHLNSQRQTGQKTRSFKVVSNDNVATYIKELVLETLDNKKFKFIPGDYIQLDIPDYDASFEYMDIIEPFHKIWKEENMFRLHVSNDTKTRRNYSMANNPLGEDNIRFNVRLATPPLGINCNAGIGSSYIFGLKKGDIVNAIGPFGDFHIKDTGNEMVFVGGGAGMAPLRSQISYLFETLKTKRKVSFWYGARSKQELFYTLYFEKLAEEHDNFTFHAALSEPKPEDHWDSHTGFIHEIVESQYLKTHSTPTQLEYYLCGPPAMINATKGMLEKYKVSKENIAFDEF